MSTHDDHITSRVDSGSSAADVMRDISGAFTTTTTAGADVAIAVLAMPHGADGMPLFVLVWNIADGFNSATGYGVSDDDHLIAFLAELTREARKAGKRAACAAFTDDRDQFRELNEIIADTFRGGAA